MTDKMKQNIPRYYKRDDYHEMLLTEGGQCRCTVVISREANPKVRSAAEDFCQLLLQMTGAQCRIVTEDQLPADAGNLVLIGPSVLTEAMGIETPTGYPDNERVILRREGERLVLLGNDDGAYNGTQFAVTLFFERQGCGWFAPDPLWHVIPKKDTISVGYLNIDHKPTFISRYNNVLYRYPEVGKRWFLGGDRRISGHGFPFMVPIEGNFEEHPEWFCMIDGKRNPFVDWWQYCYSNDEIAQVLADKICEKFEREPDLVQYSISMNDGWYHGWCECEECKKLGTPTETTLYFANKLAKLIGKRFPKHKLTFLAYFPTYRPPRKHFTLEPNLEVMFCKEADMFMPVDKGPDNGYHQRYIFKQSKNEYPTPWRENFEKWDEMVDMKHKAIWDWYCIAAAYPPWKDIPWVQGDVCTRNNRFWHDHGVESVYNDQGPLMPAFYEDGASFPLRFPLWHVAAKSWFDGDLTGSDILMDDCSKLYGGAKDLMFAYYSALADIAAHNTAYTIGWHPPKPCELYTDAAIARVDTVMNAVRAQLPYEEAVVQERLKVQIALWETAKTAIAEDAKNPDVELV
jgi:hypothetical protein